MTKVSQRVRHYCVSCFKYTNHTVKAIFTLEGNHDYRITVHYCVVQCDGCDEVSYRTETIDYEIDVYDYERDEHIPQKTIEFYPPTLKEHRNELETAYIPDKIVSAYQDTIKAFAAGALLLTAVGFRTVIEAICIEQGIKVKEFEDLKPQIKKMQDKKLITQKEADRLHTIRFLGNDSVHAMKVPQEKDLFIVLQIIEHLLNNLYVIDKQIGGKLEKMINNFAQFRTLLNKSINRFKVGDMINLSKLLGIDGRLLGDQGATFEKELIEAIIAGQYTKLSIGKTEPHTDPKLPSVQYYQVEDLLLDKDCAF
jgi:hypothetical protein